MVGKFIGYLKQEAAETTIFGKLVRVFMGITVVCCIPWVSSIYQTIALGRAQELNDPSAQGLATFGFYTMMCALVLMFLTPTRKKLPKPETAPPLETTDTE